MKKCIPFFLLIPFTLFFSATRAQKIHYSEIEKDDSRQMSFEIIGRVGGNIHIYKNYRTRNDLAIYDNDMVLKNKYKLEFLPERLLNIDFIAYPDFYYMIYQYQKRNIIHCAAVKLNGEGKIIMEPTDIDTTQVSTYGENKVYFLANSDDKQKIMIFKINRKDEKKYIFTTLLLTSELSLLKKSRIDIAVTEREGVFTDFALDNEGDLIFGRCSRGGGRDFINKLDLIVKEAEADTFNITNIPLPEKTLDEVKVKPDNANKRILVTSFYYKQHKGNIEGLYSAVFNKEGLAKLSENVMPFNDTLRADARSENTSLKMAFNDYFIKHLLPKKDGGYAILAELYYTNSRASGWNRWDYLYGGTGYSPMDYWYSPYSSASYMRYWDPWNRWNNYALTRHYYENVAIFSFDQNSNLQWTNFIRKTQYDDNTDMYLSYQLYYTAGEVHFLYNQLERRELLLNDQTISSEGEIKRNPTLRNLDKGYEFMPRFGKQVGARQIVIPCMNKNYICFAKLDY